MCHKKAEKKFLDVSQNITGVILMIKVFVLIYKGQYYQKAHPDNL